jgi:hypothetical protein
MKYSITTKVVNVKESARAILGRTTGLTSICIIEKYLKKTPTDFKTFFNGKNRMDKIDRATKQNEGIFGNSRVSC